MRPLVVLAAVLCTAGVAHADDSWDGVGTGLAVAGVVELTPLVMLAADGLAQPSSPAYGAVEVGVGGLTATLNSLAALDLLTEPCDGCSAAAPWFVGFAVLDVVTAVHGGYVIARHGKRESAVLTPTVVHNDKTTMPGLALAGRF